MKSVFLKSVLSIVIASLGSQVLASDQSSITCNMLVLKATEYTEDQSKTFSILPVTVNDALTYGSSSAEMLVGDTKVEINLIIHGDDLVKGILQIDQSTLFANKREIMSGVLVKNAGAGKGYGFDQGSAGAQQWRLMKSNSLEDVAMHVKLSTTAFNKLKPYGVNSLGGFDNLYPIYEAVSQAVKAGILKEGEPIGTAIFMGCYQ